jgi:hypothetical protein
VAAGLLLAGILTLSVRTATHGLDQAAMGADVQIQEWTFLAIPSGGGIVRHMVAAPDGTLWLACSGVGKIARVRATRTSQ